jgi:hypothetical protein
MKASPPANAQWQSFMAEPALYIDPERFAAFFDGAVTLSLSEKLRENRRLQSRLSWLLRAHYQLDSGIGLETLDEADMTIALADPRVLESIALRAGAIYWSSAIAGTVLAKAVNALHQHLGEELLGYAIAERALGGPVQSLEPLETVGERIMDDGWRCFAEWCDATPRAIALRVRLKLPQGSIGDQPAPPEFKGKGAAIFRRAAAA